MGISIELSIFNVVLLGIIFYIFKKGKAYYKKVQWDNKLEKMTNFPRDKVIVHTLPPAKTIPSGSPFVLKLLTYLRMAKIPHEIDTTEPFYGVSGKTPWITYNGVHLSDSALIIEYLNKKIDVDLSKNCTEEQRGIGRSIRIMLENNLYWGQCAWRWIHDFSNINQVFSYTPVQKIFVKLLVSRNIEKALYYQGLGRHSLPDLIKLTEDDLKSVSQILGTKKFINGSEPCEDDAAIFGVLAQAYWGLPNSPYENIMNSKEHSNLKDYCNHIKEIYWEDWNKILKH